MTDPAGLTNSDLNPEILAAGLYVVVAWELSDDWDLVDITEVMEKAGLGPATGSREEAERLEAARHSSRQDVPLPNRQEIDAAVIRALDGHQWSLLMRRVAVVVVASIEDAVALSGALHYVAKQLFPRSVNYTISPVYAKGPPWGGLVAPPWEQINAITSEPAVALDSGETAATASTLADVQEGEGS